MEVQAKQATVKGPVETFTGDVWFDVIAMWEVGDNGTSATWGDHVSDAEYRGHAQLGTREA